MPTRIAIVCSTHAGVTARLLLGCNAVAVAKSWSVRLFTPESVGYHLNEWRPDGIIVCTGEPLKWDSVLRLGRPVVGLDVELDGLPCVVPDDYAVGRLAANHLLEKGFVSFAGYGLAEHPFSERRLRGFRETVLAQTMVFDGRGEAWAPVPADWEHSQLPEGMDPSTALLRHRVKEWLLSLPRPVGIFSACDSWGMEIGTFCQMANLRVPEDVAVVAADNDEVMGELSHPPMSSVDIPRLKMGQEAALLLARMMDGEPPPLTPIKVAPAGVVVRRSSDTTAVPDPDVSLALSVILRNASRRLTVRDILRQVPTSQHALERAFRKHVGRTMLAEVRRVRVEQAKRLLATTELTLADVARKSGFSNARRMAEAFARVTATTPTAYRERFGILLR